MTDRPRGRPRHPDVLTPREWEVLGLLRQGLTNRQIAEHLRVSHDAAKYHVGEILSKLGVESREEAAAWQPEPAAASVPRPAWASAAAPLAAFLRPLSPVGKVALAGAAAAALAGLAVLAWTVLETGSGDEEGGNGAGDGGPLFQLLATIPDSPENAMYVSYIDIAQLREVAGLDRLSGDPSADELDQWKGELGAVQQTLHRPGLMTFYTDAATSGTAMQEEIGVNFTQIDQALEVGLLPANYNALRGEFDGDAVEAAVRSDPTFSDILDDLTYGGVDYYSWGEDFRQYYTRATDFRRVGVGHRLALYEDLMFWCAWTEGVEGMIDAASGNVSSLADRADYGAIAAVLDDAGAYGAFLTNVTLAADESDLPLLAAFESFAMATVLEDDGAYILIVLANADAETATDNAELVQSRINGATQATAEHPWAAGIDSVEARAEGTLTIAELRGGNLPWDFVIRQDDVLLHERAPE